jgi:intracellular septation protein A
MKLEIAMLKALTIFGTCTTLVFGVLTIFGDSDKFANNLIATIVFGAFTSVLVTTKMMSSNRENVDLTKQSWPNDVGGGSGF